MLPGQLYHFTSHFILSCLYSTQKVKFVETFDLNDPQTLAKKLENLIKKDHNFSEKIEKGFEFYNKFCTANYFLNNYEKIIAEFKYLKSIWK